MCTAPSAVRRILPKRRELGMTTKHSVMNVALTTHRPSSLTQSGRALTVKFDSGVPLQGVQSMNEEFTRSTLNCPLPDMPFHTCSKMKAMRQKNPGTDVVSRRSCETASDHLTLMCHKISRCTSCAPRTTEDTHFRQDVLGNKEVAITNQITITITNIYFLAGQLEFDDGVICLVTFFLEFSLLNHVK